MSSGGTRLLPKSGEEFSEKEFWDGFFKKRGSKAFEWYGEYSDLINLWVQYVRSGDRVLNIGCGNSELGTQLYDKQSCAMVTNIDTSATVVQQMAKKYGKGRPNLFYEVMDASNLVYDDSSYNCVVDKGTLDAMMSSADNEPVVDKMLLEVQRVLTQSGRYIVISLCQRNVIEKLIAYISAHPWIVRVHQVDQSGDSAFPLPVFFIVLTKMRVKMPKTIIEVVDGVSPPDRLSNPENDLRSWLERTQLASYAIKRQCQQSQAEFTYQCNSTKLPVLSCQLLNNKRGNGYAVFIEQLIGGNMDRGQQLDILRQQHRSRILFVQLHPWLYYNGGDAALQSLLSGLVMRFSPSAIIGEADVPFLSTGRIYPYDKCYNAGDLLVEQQFNDEGSVRIISPKSTMVHVLCCSQPPDATAGTILEKLFSNLLPNNQQPLCVGYPYHIQLLKDSKQLLMPNWHQFNPNELKQIELIRDQFSQIIANSNDANAITKHQLAALFPNCSDLEVFQQWISNDELNAMQSLVQDTTGYLIIAYRNLQQVQHLQLTKLPQLQRSFPYSRLITVGQQQQQHMIAVFSRESDNKKLDDLLSLLVNEYSIEIT